MGVVCKGIDNIRQSRTRKSLKAWLRKVNLPYRKPHSLRHGHAVYSIQQSKDISDLKAISMNLMHENLQVMDGVYGIFSGVDIQKRINNLGKENSKVDKDLIMDEIITLISKM